MPDHDVLFGQLREKIHKIISPHVVLLRSKDCNTGSSSFTVWDSMLTLKTISSLHTGTKATMKEILRQLMNTAQVRTTVYNELGYHNHILHVQNKEGHMTAT